MDHYIQYTQHDQSYRLIYFGLTVQSCLRDIASTVRSFLGDVKCSFVGLDKSLNPKQEAGRNSKIRTRCRHWGRRRHQVSAADLPMKDRTGAAGPGRPGQRGASPPKSVQPAEISVCILTGREPGAGGRSGGRRRCSRVGLTGG
jgi:hypothetical protein